MKKKIAIFDIDGTVSIIGERLDCLSGSRKDYDSFYARVGEDAVNEPIREILWSLRRSGWHIIFVTGRSESCRKETLDWLSNNYMHSEPEDLYMRPLKNTEKDYILKEKITALFLKDVSLIFEDRDAVCAMWRRLGKTCLQVKEGNY